MENESLFKRLTKSNALNVKSRGAIRYITCNDGSVFGFLVFQRHIERSSFQSVSNSETMGSVRIRAFVLRPVDRGSRLLDEKALYFRLMSLHQLKYTS